MKLLQCVALFIFCFVLVSCKTKSNSDTPSPNLIRVGVLPDQQQSKLRSKYDPLMDYLSEEIGVRFELKIPNDYSEMVNLFADKKIEMGYLGGFTYVHASNSKSVVPLVLRDVDVRFTSSFLVKTESTVKNITDLKGKTFAFGARLSTSGHIMPRYFLKDMKIIPEDFFSSVKYSGRHDTTAYWVRDGIIDIGVANSIIIDQLFAQETLSPKDVRVLWETPHYADYVWAASSTLTPSLLTKIRNAFLNLSASNQEHSNILKKLGAGHFLPANSKDFSRIAEVARETGFLKEH